jgi:release factor glutamine methyltransferase
MTGGYTDLDAAVVPSHVYAPQDESQFLIDIKDKTGLAQGSRVADLCTGIVAVAASKQGASQVTAFDLPARGALCTVGGRGCRRRWFCAPRLVGASGRVRFV